MQKVVASAARVGVPVIACLAAMVLAMRLVRCDAAPRPVVPVAAAPPPIYTVGLVYSGWSTWISTPGYPECQGWPCRWALPEIKAGLDGVEWAALPIGAQGFAVVYDSAAELRVPRGPIVGLNGASLGREYDYRGRAGYELAAGIACGLEQMANAPEGHRRLIVVSDGLDTYMTQAGPTFALLRLWADALDVEIFSLVFKGPMTSEADVLSPIADVSAVSHDTRGVTRWLSDVMLPTTH
jgi:hypothetical protein